MAILALFKKQPFHALMFGMVFIFLLKSCLNDSIFCRV